MVQQGAEGQPIPPGGGEVGDLHPTVVLGDLAAPGQQRLAGVGLPSQDRARDGAGLPAERTKRKENKILHEIFGNIHIITCASMQHVDTHFINRACFLDHARSMTADF